MCVGGANGQGYIGHQPTDVTTKMRTYLAGHFVMNMSRGRRRRFLCRGTSRAKTILLLTTPVISSTAILEAQV